MLVVSYGWQSRHNKPFKQVEHQKLTQEDLGGILGTWSCVIETSVQRVEFTLELKPDGTYAGNGIWNEAPNGTWYLTEGVIMLFDGPVEDRPHIMAALIQQKDVLHFAGGFPSALMVPMEKI